MESNSIIEKIKELVKKGNVSRIVIRKDGKEYVNIPVNAGIAVGVATLAMSKILLIAGVLATVGFGCTVEVVKDDGQVVDVVNDETKQRVVETANGVISEIKMKVDLSRKEEDDFDKTVSAEEPSDDTQDE